MRELVEFVKERFNFDEIKDIRNNKDEMIKIATWEAYLYEYNSCCAGDEYRRDIWVINKENDKYEMYQLEYAVEDIKDGSNHVADIRIDRNVTLADIISENTIAIVVHDFIDDPQYEEYKNDLTIYIVDYNKINAEDIKKAIMDEIDEIDDCDKLIKAIMEVVQ